MGCVIGLRWWPKKVYQRAIGMDGMDACDIENVHMKSINEGRCHTIQHSFSIIVLQISDMQDQQTKAQHETTKDGLKVNDIIREFRP